MSAPDGYQTLDTLFDEAWRRLESGEGAARHPALATTGPAGPEVRTVVLRAASRASHMLEIHTDTAAPKVAHIKANPAASLLVWDPNASLQIRARLLVDVLTGEAAAGAWQRVPETARARYGGTEPGVQLPEPCHSDAIAMFARFAVLRAQVTELDILHLGRERHVRALFSLSDRFTGCWISP
jgi:pyridoxamine 5'-phosphate oxidase